MCVVIFKAKINVGKWNIDDEFIAATKKKTEMKLYGLPNRKTTLKVLGTHQNSFRNNFMTLKNTQIVNFVIKSQQNSMCHQIPNGKIGFIIYQNDSLFKILFVLLPSRLHGGSPCPVKSLSLR